MAREEGEGCAVAYPGDAMSGKMQLLGCPRLGCPRWVVLACRGALPLVEATGVMIVST